MIFLKGKKVLIISPEGWEHIPVSKHHYAIALLQAGNDVYFLPPPESTFGKVSEFPNLHVVQYRAIRGVNRLPAFLRNVLNRWTIARIFSTYDFQPDVVWSFDPFRFQNLALFKAQVSVYHAVDIHQAPLEHELAASADLILSVSDMILSRFQRFNKTTKKINHGLARHFLIQSKPGLPSNGKVRVGYVGNLDNWCIDESTLTHLVKSHPEVDFTFIGPYKKDSRLAAFLRGLPNSKLLGKVSSSELPHEFSNCHFFLMCYRGDERDVNSNHHKILEFLSTGRPVVMNYTDEYNNKRDLVYMSDKNSELPALFSYVLANLDQCSTPALAAKRIAFAQANSYDQHLGEIDELITKMRNEK